MLKELSRYKNVAFEDFSFKLASLKYGDAVAKTENKMANKRDNSISLFFRVEKFLFLVFISVSKSTLVKKTTLAFRKLNK